MGGYLAASLSAARRATAPTERAGCLSLAGCFPCVAIGERAGHSSARSRRPDVAYHLWATARFDAELLTLAGYNPG